MADLVGQIAWEETVGNSLVVREPVGVVGAITPWNYPLHQIAAKVAPALAAGCTVVLKPSEVAPLNAFVLAEVIDEVGLPPGVFNLVSGTGAEVGEAIARHERDRHGVVHRLDPGREAGGGAGGGIRETGHPGTRWQVGDRDPSATPILSGPCRQGSRCAFLNSGQTCVALSRMLVPRERLAEAEDHRRQDRRVVHARQPVR